MQREINQFDKIRLKTTKNIIYLSSPDSMPNPHGVWSVVGNINRELLVCKGNALCRVPLSDVKLAGRSTVDYIMEVLSGKEEN